MNSTMSDWTTSTMSIGDDVAACIEDAARPQRAEQDAGEHDADRIARPSSATVIASKPISPAIVAERVLRGTAEHLVDAGQPARPPAISMTPMSARLTLMPAVRAAFGFAPTARNWKPMVERSRSHQTKAAATSARRKPRCSW